MAHLQTSNLIGRGWVNLFDEFPDIVVGDQFVIYNANSQYMYISTEANPEDAQIRIGHHKTIMINYTAEYAWCKVEGTVGVSSQLSADISPYTRVDLPHDLYTSSEPKIRRMRVDPGQTSFFANKQHRTYKEFNIAAGSKWCIKVDVSDDIILWKLGVELISGNIIVRTVLDDGSVTETTPFSNPVPMFRKNNMDKAPMPDINYVTALNGGQITGGLEIDRHRFKVSDNSNFAAGLGVRVGEERGVAAGTYYIEITAVTGFGTALGMMDAWWESDPWE